ncbi:MAG TPA: hypothetical protein VFT46_12975 [Holophagaceae bacterium]|nr:hypothetical protein [Holophagaceae bacterium]
MITKDQLAASMLRDCDLILHLHGKLAPEDADHRPSERQRSTLELLRYLSICAAAGLDCMAHADWSRFKGHAERAAAMPFEGFPAAMEAQKAAIAAFFAGVSEETLETQEAPLPGGRGTAPLGLAIFNGPQKWLAAYKQQLFLYAKACGKPELATANLWAGLDPAPKA